MFRQIQIFTKKGMLKEISKFPSNRNKCNRDSLLSEKEEKFADFFLLFFFLSQVRWFQQQHEKKRKKRDFVPTSFAFADYPTFFDEFGPRSRQATYHRQRNRGVPLQNLFTDPLFKEQWYLVSGPFDFTWLEPRPKPTTWRDYVPRTWLA